MTTPKPPRTVPNPNQPSFPTADDAVRTGDGARADRGLDILFVNPPAPDRAIWIRSQHRVGRRSREGMIWPQVDLAQMAALFPDYRVDVIDAIPARMTWDSFETLLRQTRPRFYVTQVTAPTLQNDMYGVFLARSLGSTTVAFGTHVTPLPHATMEAYPALDFILRGEPELTLRELVDTLARVGNTGRRIEGLERQVEGCRLKVEGSKQQVEGCRLKVESSEQQAESSELEVEGSERQVEGSRLEVEGSKQQVERCRLEVEGSEGQLEGSGLEAEGSAEQIDSSELKVESSRLKVDGSAADIEHSNLEPPRSELEIGDAAPEAEPAPSEPDDPASRWWPHLEPRFAQRLHKLFTDADPNWHPAWLKAEEPTAGQRSTCNLQPATDTELPTGDQPGVAGEPPTPNLPTFKPSNLQTQPATDHQPAPDVEPATFSLQPATLSTCNLQLSTLKGLVWRRAGHIVINPARPLIANLDDLPLPRHDLLPLDDYRAPLVGGPYAFVVTSRGCPGGCRFCIKHVSYGRSVRVRSPENVLRELQALASCGVRTIHMYADLFTLDRAHVMGICQGIVERGLDLRWTCNSRVDFVDEELLHTMAEAGCWMIAWGIESGDQRMLRRMRKGTSLQEIRAALDWSRDAGIMNWGYFIIGLPGETEETIRRTIDLAKELPLDLALFHIAAPHPGTPFFFEVVENGWFRPDTRWEQVDMDRSTVLDYPNLSAEDLERWAGRALREWALRPGPLWTYVKMLVSNPRLWGPALRIGLENLGWARARPTDR